MLVFRVDRVKSLNHIDTVIVYGTLLCSVHCNTYHVCYTHYTLKQLATDPVVLDLVQPRGHRLVYTRVYLDPMVLELEAMGCAALIIRHSKFIQIIDYVGLLDNYVLFIQSAKCLDIVLTISLSWIILCHIVCFHVMSWRSYHAMRCRVVSCHLMLCRAVSCHIIYVICYGMYIALCTTLMFEHIRNHSYVLLEHTFIDQFF